MQVDVGIALSLISSSFIAVAALLRKTQLVQDLIKCPFQFNFFSTKIDVIIY